MLVSPDHGCFVDGLQPRSSLIEWRQPPDGHSKYIMREHLQETIANSDGVDVCVL
jgi:hypothetical protein